jgi:hypothetical protein
VATATLDVIAADHPPAAAWSNNNHALTNVAVLSVSGNTGATSASRYAGATGSGAPVSGTFNLGDFTVDQSGTFWVCTAAGTPGTWAAVAKVSQIPSSLPPNGAAGGVLSGTYPNPGITTLNQNTTGTASNITGTLDQVPAPAANVSLNSHKVTGLANGSAATDAAAFGQVPVIDSTASDIQPAPGTQAAGSTGKTADAGHVHSQPPSFAPAGLTGATAASRYVGATTSGAPVTGTFAVGDQIVDQTGTQWVCTAAGTPGTWVSLLPSPLWAGLTNGEATLPRLGQGDSGSFGDTPASGVLHLTLFRAVTNGTYQHIGFQTGGTAQSAITLSKVGLYSVSGSTYTLLSGSASSAFSGTFANQSKALGAAQTLTAGATYAVAQLQVGTTPSSTLGSWFNGMVLGGNPDYAFTLAAQSDLPASITSGLSTSQFPMYYEVLT